MLEAIVCESYGLLKAELPQNYVVQFCGYDAQKPKSGPIDFGKGGFLAIIRDDTLISIVSFSINEKDYLDARIVLDNIDKYEAPIVDPDSVEGLFKWLKSKISSITKANALYDPNGPGSIQTIQFGDSV